MSIETDFRALLVAAPAVVALVGAGIALNQVGDSQPLPYIVFTAEHAYMHTLGGELADDTATLNVQCWGNTSTQAELVADAVMLAIEAAPQAACAAALARQSAFDPETQLDATVLTVTWSA